jgi:hypothetical protein
MDAQRTALFSVCVIALLACSHRASGSPIENIKQHFVASVTQGWDTYKVCVHYSRRDDRKAFYTQVLELAPGSLQQVVDYREMTTRQSGTGPATHLGVAEILFSTAAAAQSFAQPAQRGPRYFAASKILTRYVVLQKERSVLVIYSESHMRPEAAKFLDAAEASGADLYFVTK